jgi:hypothetical protein
MMAGPYVTQREMPPDSMAPVIEFDDFMTYVFDWRQNQHVGVVGPTEQGKTNLVYHLLAQRQYVTYFAIKTRDETLEKFADQGGYVRIDEWPPTVQGRFRKRLATPQDMPKRLLWPDATQLHAEVGQKAVFDPALRDIYSDGGWCPVFDDYWYLANILGFEKETKKYLANARSNNIPMVICAQRPAGNRLVELFDQSTHLFFARDNDTRNLKTIGGVGWLNDKQIQMFVASLERFQFLYVNTRNGWMYRTTAPELKFGRGKRRA